LAATDPGHLGDSSLLCFPPSGSISNLVLEDPSPNDLVYVFSNFERTSYVILLQVVGDSFDEPRIAVSVTHANNIIDVEDDFFGFCSAKVSPETVVNFLGSRVPEGITESSSITVTSV
jgi:hypothetical protein